MRAITERPLAKIQSSIIGLFSEEEFKSFVDSAGHKAYVRARLIKCSCLVRKMKKTEDGRFIETRIQASPEELQRIILGIKLRENYTWQEFASVLGVSKDTLRIGFYIKNQTLPLSVYTTLLSLNKDPKIKVITKEYKPFWGQSKGKKSPLESKLLIPDINNPLFAEFLGIMAGDGCIYANLSGICVSGHKTQDFIYYSHYLCKLIVSLFGITPRLYLSKDQNEIRCVVYSKKIALFLKSLGFPLGKKLFSPLIIPKQYFEDTELLNHFLRGMFDTDGSIYSHPTAKIILEISIRHKQFKRSCFQAFQKIGIPFKESTDRLYLSGNRNSQLFFSLVGSSNIKHSKKYSIYNERGFVPRQMEIESYLKQ